MSSTPNQGNSTLSQGQTLESNALAMLSTGTNLRLMAGLVGVSVLLLIWLLSCFVAYDPGADADLSRRFEPPQWSWTGDWQPLGRDHFGRNLALMMMTGTGAFFIPAFVASVASIPTALWLAQYPLFDKPEPRLLGPLFQGLKALPDLAWLAVIAAMTHQNHYAVGLTLGLLSVPVLYEELSARLARLAQRGVLEGARAHGLSARYIRRHYYLELEALPVLCRFLPSLWSRTLLTQAALDYLGDFGGSEANAGWGRLLRDLAPRLFRAEPGAALWVALVPLAAIAGSSLSFHLLGSGLTEHLEGRPNA